ncbi:hypothetical protein RhiirB3_385876 [Rhizophagus irregularis]|nr:hypothetical protein RhiirB3_385876 [Rhizophagus irregularis]
MTNIKHGQEHQTQTYEHQAWTDGSEEFEIEEFSTMEFEARLVRKLISCLIIIITLMGLIVIMEIIIIAGGLMMMHGLALLLLLSGLHHLLCSLIDLINIIIINLLSDYLNTKTRVVNILQVS